MRWPPARHRVNVVPGWHASARRYPPLPGHRCYRPDADDARCVKRHGMRSTASSKAPQSRALAEEEISCRASRHVGCLLRAAVGVKHEGSCSGVQGSPQAEWIEHHYLSLARGPKAHSPLRNNARNASAVVVLELSARPVATRDFNLPITSVMGDFPDAILDWVTLRHIENYAPARTALVSRLQPHMICVTGEGHHAAGSGGRWRLKSILAPNEDSRRSGFSSTLDAKCPRPIL